MPSILSQIRDLKRFQEIIGVFSSEGFGYYISHISSKESIKIPGVKVQKTFDKQEAAVRMARSFERLGGAFVKLGQMLSVREDLLPKEFCDEFKKLQDDVKPFPFSDVKSIIEEQLKKPIKDAFSEIDETPIAAASIAQAHIATLKDKTKVVLKVQRPRSVERFASDIDLMMFIAQMIEKHFPVSFARPSEIIKEFSDYTSKELNFIHEAKSVDRFYSSAKGYVTPKVFWEYCTPRIVVLEYLQGTKLKDYKGTPGKKQVLAKRLMDAIYTQVFVDGNFHADPHPGNILVMSGDRIAFVDFGITGYLDLKTRDGLADLLIGLVEKDIDKIVDSLLGIGVAGYGLNKDKLKSDIQDHFSVYYNRPLSSIKLSDAIRGLIEVTKDNHLKLPLSLVLLAKCAVTVEAVVFNLDPKFNPVESAQPFIEGVIKRRYAPSAIYADIKKHAMRLKNLIIRAPEISDEIVRGIEKGDRGIKTLDHDMRRLTIEMDRSTDKIALSLIVMSLFIASALLVNIGEKKAWGISYISLTGFAISLFLLFLLIMEILRENNEVQR